MTFFVIWFSLDFYKRSSLYHDPTFTRTHNKNFRKYHVLHMFCTHLKCCFCFIQNKSHYCGKWTSVAVFKSAHCISDFVMEICIANTGKWSHVLSIGLLIVIKEQKCWHVDLHVLQNVFLWKELNWIFK